MSLAPSGVRRSRGLCCAAGFALLVAGCAGTSDGAGEAPPAAPSAANSAVTAWGRLFEVYVDLEPLVAGSRSVARVQVTALADFRPLPEGRVEIAFDTGETWSQSQPERAGIFAVELLPTGEGERQLLIRVRSSLGDEEVRGGRVRIGDVATPGRVVVAPAPKGATDNAQPVALLKDQQWSSNFATDWVRSSQMARSVRALGRVRPAAGGDVTLTAPVHSLALPRPWPYLGQAVSQGSEVVRLSPLVAEEESLAELQGEVRSLESLRRVAEANAARHQSLWENGVTSQRDAEEAQAELESLSASLEAARHDLAAARAAREGLLEDPEAPAPLVLTAPFAGRVAAIEVSPGEAVDAGQSLVRIVRTSRVWVALALSVTDAVALGESPELAGLVLRRSASGDLRFPSEEVRFVSRSPEVDPHRGTVEVLIELSSGDRLLLGESLEAELLLAETEEGIVVPTSALVDDGGVPVVYLQLSGERFVRQSVTVRRRQGELALVEGPVPGQRLVLAGGDVIRRSVLLQSGGSHGHVH